MIQYPLYFKEKAIAAAGVEKAWQSATMKEFPPIICSIPHEFHGPDLGYSPEDLLTQSAMNCFIATFKVFAAHANLKYDTISSEGTLTIDRTKDGEVALTKLEAVFTLVGVEDRKEAAKLLEEAQKNCLVPNALSIDVDFQFLIG